MSTTIQGVIAMPGSGKYQIIMPEAANSFKLKLASNTDWYLGIDQSTSCTGLALESSNGKFVILLDVIRDKRMMKEDFFKDLRRLINGISFDQEFLLVANEKPVPRKFAHARETLLELLGRLNTWIEDNPAFEYAAHEALFPQTWKSKVVDKTKGKNRSNIKSEVASDLVDRFPELQHYFEFYHTDDYDSFDALGILEGARQYAYTANGYPKIHGSLEKTHTALALYQWAEWDDTKSYEENLAEIVGDMCKVLEPVILRYNPDYSLNENIRMCSSNYQSVLTVVPHDCLTAFQWKFGIDISESNKRLILIAVRKGNFTASTINALCEYLPMNEEVFAE